MAWVLLSYRVPRTPSTPRIAVWRRLNRLGAAHLGDGLVALPEDARTREQLEWVAGEVEEAGGTATIWQAQTMRRSDACRIATDMAAARAKEYRAITEAAFAACQLTGAERARQLRRLRRELRAVQRRDYFPTGERAPAVIAVRDLAKLTAPPAGALAT
ncbi:MAG: Chromate resistance protein ChrB [Nocardioidaceae bacterium]|nr:chromate resistance protein [Nocardioidaceae bacterium]